MDVVLRTLEPLSNISTPILTLYIWQNVSLQGGIAFAYFLAIINMGYFLSTLMQLNST